jgi:hypothetical protein
MAGSNHNDEELQTKRIPGCPRCDSQVTQLVTTSPVPGAWSVYSCLECFYGWRSSEPDYATQSNTFDRNFRINPEEIDLFLSLPTVPELLKK